MGKILYLIEVLAVQFILNFWRKNVSGYSLILSNYGYLQ